MDDCTCCINNANDPEHYHSPHCYDLDEILETMDIPEGRKGDLRWLLRNLAARNGNHPQYNDAIFLIRDRLGEN